MLLEATPKTCNKEGDAKGEKDLSNLVLSLDTLSINEPPSKEVTQLEYAITIVSLTDEKDSNEAEKEVETSKEEILPATPEKVTTDDEEKSESKDEKETEKEESKKEETEKDGTKNVSDEKEASSPEVEKKEKVATESKEKKEESKEEKKQEPSEKDVSDSDNESSSDEAASNESAPVKEKKEKKLLRRGFGAGTQNDQHYQYPMYQAEYGNYQCEPPAVAPISYAPQLTMSPQQAMSPGYSNMPVLPVPGYTESMYMQNGEGYFDNTMSSFLGSPSMGVDPYWIPDTPPSPIRDDSDLPVLQGLTSTESSSVGHSPDDVLEAISRVESHPTGSVAPENLIPIKNQLFAELDIPDDISSLISDSNIDCQVDSEYNNNLQSCLMDYPNLLSPPAEEDSFDNNAEREIRGRLDEAQYKKAILKVAGITNEELTNKDSEGDNPCVVVACKDESSPKYYEHLVAVVERARTIEMCCDKPVSKEKRCVVCGNTNRSTFYSPFAMCNNEGDTLLRSVIRAQKSDLVISYICENLYNRQADINIIFGGQNTEFYRYLLPRYRILSRFLPSGF